MSCNEAFYEKLPKYSPKNPAQKLDNSLHTSYKQHFIHKFTPQMQCPTNARALPECEMSDPDHFEYIDPEDSATELMEACTCLGGLRAELHSWEQLTKQPMPTKGPCARPPVGWDEAPTVLHIASLPDSERRLLVEWLDGLGRLSSTPKLAAWAVWLYDRHENSEDEECTQDEGCTKRRRLTSSSPEERDL